MFLSKEDYATKEAVLDAYPAIDSVVEVVDGWQTFETVTDRGIWENQK